MSQHLYLNSNDRISGTSTDYHVLIDDNLLRDQHKDIAVSECIIPHSYYAINDNNKTFVCGMSGAFLGGITLDVGNYTAADFATHLSSKLSAALSPEVFTVAFSSQTGKLTFSTLDTTDFVITTDNKNYKYLGFAKNSTNTSSSGVLVSSNVINISGTEYIDVCSNLTVASENSSNLNRNVLTRVYPNSSPFSSIFYNATSDNATHFNGQHIQRLHLQLKDEFGDIIDLNGLDWALTLRTVPRVSFEHKNKSVPQSVDQPNRGF